MLMESQELESVNHVRNSPDRHHTMSLDSNNLKSGEGTDQESVSSITTSPPPQPKAFLERNLPGTKDEVSPRENIALHFVGNTFERACQVTTALDFFFF